MAAEGLSTGPAEARAAPLPASGKSRFRRWRRRLLLAALVVVCVYIFRVPLLRGVGRFLVVDEFLPTADYILLLDGDDDCKKAAQLFHAGFAQRILLLQRYPERLERLKILPTHETRIRCRLKLHGVAEEAVVVLPGDARDDWEQARCLSEWLGAHPQATVAALCDRVGSRRRHFILDTVLGRKTAARVLLYPLPDRGYDETNWWLTKEGTTDVFRAYLRLAHAWISGEGRKGPEWDLDQYEKTLR